MPKPPTIRTKIRAPIQVEVAIVLPSDSPCDNKTRYKRRNRYDQAQYELVVKNSNGKGCHTHFFKPIRNAFQHSLPRF